MPKQIAKQMPKTEKDKARGRPPLTSATVLARKEAERKHAELTAEARRQRERTQRLLGSRQVLPVSVAAALAAIPKLARVVTPPELYDAILDVLHSAARLQHFTSLTLPCWDGWATARMIAWRIDHAVSEARFSLTEPGEDDSEAWYYVPATLGAAARAGELETRIIRPLRFSEDKDVAAIQCPAYRLPGDVGYCRWHPEQPEGAIPGEPYDDPALMDSRQVRLIRAELAAMGCGVPPFLLARFEKYAKNKSGLRALR